MNTASEWQREAKCANAPARAFDTHGGWAIEANWIAVTRWSMFCPVARECAADARDESARGVVRAVPLTTVGTGGRLSRPARDGLARIAEGTSTPAREATRALGAIQATRGTPGPTCRPAPGGAHTGARTHGHATASTS